MKEYLTYVIYFVDLCTYIIIHSGSRRVGAHTTLAHMPQAEGHQVQQNNQERNIQFV